MLILCFLPDADTDTDQVRNNMEIITQDNDLCLHLKYQLCLYYLHTIIYFSTLHMLLFCEV